MAIDYTKLENKEFIESCLYRDSQDNICFDIPKILEGIGAEVTEENKDILCIALEKVLNKLFPDTRIITTQRKHYSQN